MTDDRNELLEEANTLGLEFPPNIKTEKLKGMIEESKGPAVKKEPEEDTSPEKQAPTTKQVTPEPKTEAGRKHLNMREKIAAAKKRAMKLSIVTITNKDNRENDVMTTVPLSFENEHFGLGRNVPLDIPVELEQALIEIAEGTTMTLHKDEIKNGKRTGNKTPMTVKKFAVSYGKPQE